MRLYGGEADFYRAQKTELKPLLEEAGDVIGQNLAKRLESGRIDELNEAQRQFFTYSFSVGVFNVLSRRGITVDLLAGYSFGIYAALCVSGALSYSDGLRILQQAYTDMHEVCGEGRFGMGIVVGLTQPDVDELLSDKRFASVVQVNSNNDICKVVSGKIEDVEHFLQQAMRRDALKAEKLHVSIPYHHPGFLREASVRFSNFLDTLAWQDPSIPVVSSIDQVLMQDADALKSFTAANLSTPIHWQHVVETLHAQNITRVIECGPGVSLTQNGRFFPFSMKYINGKKFTKELGL